MDYTTNYHLPQWVETDRVQMEDFNAAMAGIEDGLSKGAQEYRLVNTYGMAVDSTVYTFPRAPRFVILFGSYASTCVAAGSTGSMIDYYTYSAERKVGFQLTGNKLILKERENSAAASTLRILAFY